MGLFSRQKQRDPDYPQQVERLEATIRTLKDELADLKHEKKITEEDIKHMVRIEKERIEVQNERKELERDREKEAAIAKVKDEYRDKMEKRLETEVKNIKSMYDEILKRLPTVTVRQHDSRHEEVGGEST